MRIWPNELAITYHAVRDDWDSPLSVRVADFRDQLRLLFEAGYRAVTMSELRTRRWTEPVIAITFDDGFASVRSAALPILDELGWVASVFVTTDAVDRGEAMKWLAVPGRAVPEGALLPLTWGDIEELSGRGWEIGSHTKTHSRLSTLTTPERKDELEGSRRRIIDVVGSCASISYPWGETSAPLAAAARQAGYTAGSGLEGRFVVDDTMRIPRVAISRFDSEARFRLKCSTPFGKVRSTRMWDALEVWRAPRRHDDQEIAASDIAGPSRLRCWIAGDEALRGDHADRWELLREAVGATPYAGPVFLRLWLEHLGSGWRPFVVLVEEQESGRLVAVAPLVRRHRVAVCAPGRLAVAGELVADSRAAPAAWRVVAETLGTSRDVAFTLFPHLPIGRRGKSGAEAALATTDLPWRTWPRFVRYTLDLRDRDFETYFASLTRKTRYGYRSTHDRLGNLGEVSVRRVGGVAAYEHLRPLHVRQWSADRTIHWVHTEGGMSLDRSLFAAYDTGGLVVEVDGRTIAAAVFLDVSGKRIVPYVARDIDLKVGSPGLYLWIELIRSTFGEGLELLDTLGQGAIKDQLNLQRQIEYELVLGSGRFSGRAAVGARRLQLAVRELMQPSS